ncbi:hypothetical protein ACFBZI_07565 [Moraxella sp. ZJ142]|uniref:hypothetical protein n=1 Tax=Moraxella marmotae TaxID=3344520 RepID=UPI0035D4BCC7
MHYQFVRSLAESFEHISRFESACYHYLYNADCTARRDYFHILYHHYYDKCLIDHPRINRQHLDKLVNAALLELTYPVASDGYAWSTNDRCLCTGISRRSWYRHSYHTLIKSIIDEVRTVSDTVDMLIGSQLADYYKANSNCA